MGLRHTQTWFFEHTHTHTNTTPYVTSSRLHSVSFSLPVLVIFAEMAPNKTTTSFWTVRTWIKGLLTVHVVSGVVTGLGVSWFSSGVSVGMRPGLEIACTRGPNTVMRLLSRTYEFHNCENKRQGEEEHLWAQVRFGHDLVLLRPFNGPEIKQQP